MAALVRQPGSPIEKLKIPTPRARSESTAKSATNNLLAISLAGPGSKKNSAMGFLFFWYQFHVHHGEKVDEKVSYCKRFFFFLTSKNGKPIVSVTKTTHGRKNTNGGYIRDP